MTRMVILVAFCAVGCGPGDDGECLAELPRDCAPLYTPSFDEIYTRRLVATCGASSTGASCHAPAGAQAGLVFSDADSSYAELLGTGGDHARVLPGDPECSLVMRRLASGDPGFQMPPGAPLSEAELCTFTQWIANGAER